MSLSSRISSLILPVDPRYRVRGFVLGLGIVMLILGAKLWLIDQAGTSLPVLDQVDGEGEVVLRPWLEERLHWGNFWHPHNEHRIALTKLLALGLVAVNGQWDAYVEMLVGGLMHALLLPMLMMWLRPHIPDRRAWAFLAVVTTALWMLPINSENTLQGFQNQFYFVLWLTILQLRGVLGSDRVGWRWAGGQLCGLLALGAMGSGLLSSVAVVMVTGIEMLRSRTIHRFGVITILVSAGWIGFGWWSRNHVAAHEVMQAQSVGELFKSLWQVLTWPYLAAFAPAALLGLVVPFRMLWLITRGEVSPFTRMMVGLAIWFGLIAIATAFYRSNGVLLSSRYYDQFYVGLFLQGLSLATLASARWRWISLTIWVASLGFALTRETTHTIQTTVVKQSILIRAQEDHVRAFLATGDEIHFTGVPRDELPLPHPELLIDRWSHTVMHKIMPAAVRRPLPIPEADKASQSNLPPAPYPVIAVSPMGPQIRPWIWRSERQPATTLPVLRFRFSGGLGDPAAALSFRVISDQGIVEVHPDSPAEDRWKTVNVIRPNGQWWIELTDSDELQWFALTAPVEMGWASWAAEKAIKHHVWIMCLGLGLILAAFMGFRHSSNRSASAAN